MSIQNLSGINDLQKIITHINLAKGFRGGERQTMLLIEELSLNGYHQKLVTRKNSDLAKRLQQKDLKNLSFVEISKPYIMNVGIFKNDDIVHVHETKAAQFAYFVNLIYKVPYIITRRVDNPIKNNFFNKKLYENASFVAVLSSAIKEETLKISQKINIQVIPSAYSKLCIDNKNVEKLKQRFQGRFVIGNIGELDNTHKGQYYLIEAAKLLEKKYPEMLFLFLGRGKDEEKYKIQSKDIQNIIFEGFVDNVGDYIACMDLFVFPSLNEGLGSILLDVMEQKVPIIASNVGGIPDIIKDGYNGLLVEIKDVDAIYEMILKLYQNKELCKNLVENGFKSVGNYSKEIMCERYIKIYGT